MILNTSRYEAENYYRHSKAVPHIMPKVLRCNSVGHVIQEVTMTVLEYCQSLTKEMDEHRLIIMSADHKTLADSTMILLYNFRQDTDDLCATMHKELLNAECISVNNSDTALTIVVNADNNFSTLPGKVILRTFPDALQEVL